MDRWLSRTIPLLLALSVVAVGSGGWPDPVQLSAQTRGPLRIHPGNPRYFADDTGRPVYLTGSHFWTTIQDWNGRNAPYHGGPAFWTFPEYVAFLRARHHNFTRLWTFDHLKYDSAPNPWLRTGPGTAFDGRPRFDVSRVNPEFLARLRDRVLQFRAAGIYVSVMFFRGNYALGGDPAWDAHPFNPANNVNPELAGLGYDAYNDLSHPASLALQKQYVAAVVDALNDLDNVVWEIANEAQPRSYPWQQHMADFVRGYEMGKPRQHLVGITSTYPHDNASLYRTTADWISPGLGDYDPEDPPAATGRHIVVSDSDHHLLERASVPWVWKSFLRGEHPILMENELAWDLERVRFAMGHARAQAERVNLAAMTPRSDLTQTRFGLADPGVEYLVYAPSAGAFWVDLSAAPGRSFTVEWISPTTGTSVIAGAVLGGHARQPFTAPFDEAGAVLYLRGVAPITVAGSARPAPLPAGRPAR